MDCLVLAAEVRQGSARLGYTHLPPLCLPPSALPFPGRASCNLSLDIKFLSARSVPGPVLG